MTPSKGQTDARGRLVYSTDRKDIVKIARARGMTDAEILASVTTARVRADRVSEIRSWAQHLGLSPDEAMDLARKNAII